MYDVALSAFLLFFTEINHKVQEGIQMEYHV